MTAVAPVVMMAGGTGGHVFPALAVARRLRADGVPVVWMGTRRGLEAQLVPADGIPMVWIDSEGLRGTGLRRWVRAPWGLLRAVWQAARALRQLRPRLVVGMGGFASGPGGLAAWMLRCPLLIHEQNAIPGLTNRCLSRLAGRVLQAFPESFPPGRAAVVTGNPVREAIAALPPPQQRLAGRSGPLRLLVLGGSRGAQALNALVPQALARIPLAQRPQLRHQAGAAMLEAARQAYAAAGLDAQPEPFIEDMAAAYGWADVVLCRAGALTIAELEAAGVGAILVPYPHAVDDHQAANAAHLARAGAAEVIRQHELDAERLAALLMALAEDRPRLLAMASAARNLTVGDAAAVVTRHCMEVARPAAGAPS